jgi:hypothetical protein
VSVKKGKRVGIGKSLVTSGRLHFSPELRWSFAFSVGSTSDCNIMKYLTSPTSSLDILVTEVERSVFGDEFVAVLERLINFDWTLELVLVEHGTVMIINNVAHWRRFSDSDIRFIDQESPWQNA